MTKDRRSRPPFTPGLALHALTPLYDRAVDLLGFGHGFIARVAQVITLQDGETFLDVGCGTGSLLAELAPDHPRSVLIGIDADQTMLVRARGKLAPHARLRLARAYAQTLPFPGAAFDVVASTLIFHHLPTEVKRQAIAEIYRVLKPGGRFLLADFGRPQTLIQRILLRTGSLFDGIGNMRVNLAGALPSMLERAEFRVAEAAPRYRAVQFLLATK